ncbi:family 31 glycosyltransferase [Thelonectria olida]|uniref:Family 31 glycosyltransferase n=1 Tax=Thelonectria olida TaxID=1576542 RepID=A0A9P8W2S0_9HYPO|nr:family 31 glycosyltransferase [Thelonectria olida]
MKPRHKYQSTMGARYKTPFRLNMRHPLNRAMAFAVVLLFFLSLMLRPETSNVRSRLFGAVEEASKKKHMDEIVAVDDDPLSLSPFMDVELEPISTHQMDCSIDSAHLSELRKRHDLSYTVQYLKRYVRFARTDGLERSQMTKLNQTMVTGKFKTVQIGRKYQKEECQAPLELPVPKSGFPATVNASDFLFGVSTTYERFMNPDTTPIGEWIYWLTDSHGHTNGAHLVLMLLDATDHQLQEVANLLGDVGINVDVYHSDSGTEMAVRYVTLVPTLYTHREAANKKWLVTCDDDTYFPSMHGLINKLKTYDSELPMYIGTLSEDAGAVERHGSQAFGGAGVFLTLSMAEKITANYEECSNEKSIHKANSGWGAQGDILLRNCIYEHSDTRLTNLWDLWQLDFLGDPSGFYEWGIKPLSLHHYRGRGWHLSRPVQMSKIAHTCGEDCTMLRFKTSDNFIVSGYSVAHYPQGVNFDYRQVESTLWAPAPNRGWNFDYMFGPQRPSLHRTGRKIAWELVESEVNPDGSVIQTYIRHKTDERWVGKDEKPMSKVDGIIELVWIPE